MDKAIQRPLDLLPFSISIGFGGRAHLTRRPISHQSKSRHLAAANPIKTGDPATPALPASLFCSLAADIARVGTDGRTGARTNRFPITSKGVFWHGTWDMGHQEK